MKGNKENKIKKVNPPKLCINPCFPKPFIEVKISYLNNININNNEKIKHFILIFFILLIKSNEEIVRPVIAKGIVSERYPTENFILSLYWLKKT